MFFQRPPHVRQWGWPWGSRGEPDQICPCSGGTFHLKSETGNKHVTVQFQLEEGLRGETGDDIGKVVLEGF